MMLVKVFIAFAIICSPSYAAPPGQRRQNHGNNGNTDKHGHSSNGRHVGNGRGHGNGHGRDGGNGQGNGRVNWNHFGHQSVDRHENSSTNIPSASEPLTPLIPSEAQMVTSWEEWQHIWTDSHQSCGYPGTTPTLQDLRVATLPGDEHSHAQMGNYPWMASLKVSVVNSTTPSVHHCGGTLISDQWVVTAAHCLCSIRPPDIWGEQSWIVSLGVLNISAHEETEQVFKVNRIMVHPGFDMGMVMPLQNTYGWPSDHDIALVKLSGPAHVNPWVRPACLPGHNQDLQENKHCVVTGWGFTAESNTISDVLKQGTVPIMNYKMCKALDVYNDWLTPNMVCAGYWNGGIDACKYDSGGPLQCQYGNQWYVAGVVSWGDKSGPGCAKPLRPGVYTRIDTHISWIQETVYADYAGLPIITWDKIIPKPDYHSHT